MVGGRVVHESRDAAQLPRVHRLRKSRADRAAPAERGRPSGPGPSQAPIEQVVPLVRRALKVLIDREVTPQLGLLKSTLLQLDSTFSERTYGAGSFRDFAQKLAVRRPRRAARIRAQCARRARREQQRIGRRSGVMAPPPSAPSSRAAAVTKTRMSRQDAAPSNGGRHRAAHRGRHSGSPAPVPGRAESAALADVHPTGEAVPAQRRHVVRRTEVRLCEPRRSDARLPARRAVPDRARPSGRHALVPRQRHAGR